MNQQLVLGTAGLSAVSTLETITTVAAGAYAFVVNGTNVYAAGEKTNAEDRVQIFAGIANAAAVQGISPVMCSVPIRVGSVLGITRDIYAADIVGVYTIALAGLATDTEGEGYIALSDNSFNRTIANDKVSVNLIKKKGETAANFVTRLVAKLNNNATLGRKFPFFTAAASTTNVVITMKSADTDFTVAMDGILSGFTKTTTTAPKPSTTRAVDILATEKEFSGNLGNGNYEKLTDAWWSFPQQTNLAATYDIITIKFQGEHDTPQNRQRSAVMWLKIAVPTAQGAALAQTLADIFNDTVTNYQSGAVTTVLEDADGGTDAG